MELPEYFRALNLQRAFSPHICQNPLPKSVGKQGYPRFRNTHSKMNPLTNMKNVLKLSEMELKRNSKSSWHDMYRNSAWIFVGGLPYELTEGDVICVFSQFGEIVNINLIRDKETGKSRGYGFMCYEDQRSTVLAVDNLNGVKILDRTIRVDHVSDYKPPKENHNLDEVTKQLHEEGCAPKPQIPENLIKKERVTDIRSNGDPYAVRLPERLPIRDYVKSEPQETKVKVKKEKKPKKDKKSKKSKKDKKSKKKRKRYSSSSSALSGSSSSDTDTDDSTSRRNKRKKRK